MIELNRLSIYYKLLECYIICNFKLILIVIFKIIKMIVTVNFFIFYEVKFQCYKLVRKRFRLKIVFNIRYIACVDAYFI